MTLALISMPVVAALALTMLLVLWVLTSKREIGRLRRRKTLRLAARLRSELVKQLGDLEARNTALREQAAREVPRRRIGTPRPVVGPDLIEDLHATLISDLRRRADRAYHAIRFERVGQLESRCRTLEEITREVDLLAAEIGGREAVLGAGTTPRRSSQRPSLSVVRVA